MDLDEIRNWISEKTDHYFDSWLYPEEFEEFVEKAEDRELEDDLEDDKD